MKMSRRWNCKIIVSLVVLWTSCIGPHALAGGNSVTDQEKVLKELLPMTVEDLMNIEVTSAGKKAQKMSETSAAIFVITQEDIRRGGFRSIPEALRLVPGLAVAQVDASRWAISARGFNGLFNTKQLVLLDGRSLYTPLFGGIQWDVQDTLLADIDRIEVIRGPGSSLWGANAMNGVINIITKPARATEGTYVATGGGNLEQGFVDVRHGGRVGNKGAYRIYGKYFNRNNFLTAAGGAANDAWQQGRTGFRTDWELSSLDAFTVQGDGYLGTIDLTARGTSLTPPLSFTTPITPNVSGGNVLMRWTRTFSPSSNIALQLYYDHIQRDRPDFGIRRHTYDLDFQHRFPFGVRQDIVWGVGYRLTHDKITNSFQQSFIPDEQGIDIINVFFQDDIDLIPKYLRLTLGTKISHNTFTGIEYQPNGRLLWSPHPLHVVWAAISRGVRFPTRSERHVRVNIAASGTSPLLLTSLLGNPQFRSEELLAYELGYRTRMFPEVSIDVAAFYNVYRHVASLRTGSGITETSPAPTHTLIPLQFTNERSAHTYGVEVALRWQATSWWMVSTNYSFLQMQLSPVVSGLVSTFGSQPGSNPKHQIQVRSLLDLPYHLTFDTGLFYVSSLNALGVPDYTRVDVRLAWKPRPDLEISLIGQNLFDNQHPEFTLSGAAAGSPSSEVPRSVYGQVTWAFSTWPFSRTQ